MIFKYLVDTDWVIHHLHGRKDITAKLREFRKDGVAISVISLAELYEGVYYSHNPVKDELALNLFLSDGIVVVGIDEDICRIFAQERGRLRNEKKLIGDFDLFIASTCLYYKLTLLTGNKKHFEVVKSLQIYS